jgi:hypothetical protein
MDIISSVSSGGSTPTAKHYVCSAQKKSAKKWAGFLEAYEATPYPIASKLTISRFDRRGIPRMPVTAANPFHAP